MSVARVDRTNEDASPDAPRISPLKRRRVAAERPMSDPPRRPLPGVNELRDIVCVDVSISF